MAVVVCLLLLLSYSIAGQARPSALSLTTGRQNKRIDEKATGKPWLYSDGSKILPAIHGTVEPDEVLVKRTSSRSPSSRRWSPHGQGTGLQPVPPNNIYPGAPFVPLILGGDHSRWPGLSTAPPSQVPGDAPVATHTEPGSSSKQPAKANRRPYRSLKNDPIAKAKAHQESNARNRAKKKRTALMVLGKLKYATASKEDITAVRTGRTQRWLSSLTAEEKLDWIKRRNESSRRCKERKRAKLRGNNSPGPPLRKHGRKAVDWDQRRAMLEKARLDGHADTRMEEATQNAVDVPHASPGAHGSGALKLRTAASSSGSLFVPEQDIEASYHRFMPGPLSPPLNHGLLLTAPGSSTSAQRQTQALPQAAPLLARTMEEERLRLTLAPPDEHDWLELTLAPPRQN